MKEKMIPDSAKQDQVVVLQFPFEFRGESIQTLTMRRPKVRDMLAVEKLTAKDNAEKEIQLFANLCEVVPEVLHELDMSDYTQLQTTHQGFLSSSPQK